MAEAGAQVDRSLLRGAVMGWTGPLGHLGFYVSLLRRLRRRWTSRRPAAVVLVDFPGFNLRVARIAHRLGIPVYYFVCPQVWAWGAQRLITMRRLLRRAFLILPFEEPLYSAYGIDGRFVGHPLLETFPARIPPRRAVLKEFGLDPSRPLGILLPGSRPDELKRHVPLVAEAVRMAAVRPSLRRLQWAVVAAPGAQPQSFRALEGLARVVRDPSCRLRAQATLVWSASGTATLETGLLGVPQVVFYRTSALNAFIVLRILRVRRASLVNLILGKDAVPELLQSAATPRALVEATGRILGRGGRGRARARAVELCRLLGTGRASREVAASILADLRESK